MNTLRRHLSKHSRRYVLLGASVALTLYVGFYARCRLRHEIIHRRSIGGGHVYHGVEPGMPHGPTVFFAAIATNQLDQLPVWEAAFERRRKFVAVFYAPLGLAETLVWRIIDRKS